MKSVKFRPLRRIKKSGKVTVASYLTWRKVKTADYLTFNLIVDNEYKDFKDDELVYNHNGENLFWRNFNPDKDVQKRNRLALVDGEQPEYPERWVTDYGMYCSSGMDVDGVPTFSHLTANEVATHKTNFEEYEPLTVGVVKWWIGWFLYQLENNTLQFAKD